MSLHLRFCRSDYSYSICSRQELLVIWTLLQECKGYMMYVWILRKAHFSHSQFIRHKETKLSTKMEKLATTLHDGRNMCLIHIARREHKERFQSNTFYVSICTSFLILWNTHKCTQLCININTLINTSYFTYSAEMRYRCLAFHQLPWIKWLKFLLIVSTL